MSSVASQLYGSPAGLFNPARFGTATIVQNTQAIAVADDKITANSVVYASLGLDNGALATQEGFSVCLEPGVGFTLRSSAIATALGSGLKVNWAVLKY